MLLAEFGVGVGVGLRPLRFPDGSRPFGGVVPDPKLPEHAARTAPANTKTATRNRALFIEARYGAPVATASAGT